MMTYIDSAILDLTEWFCHKFQLLTGRTNVWLAVQLTNLSIIVYFVWAAVYFWTSDVAVRIAFGLFCSGLWYVLTQTIFKVPIEAYENNAYRRVAKGYRNPRRLREAHLRIPFLTLSVLLLYPILYVYFKLRVHIPLLSYSLIVLTTAVLYLLACDPLAPCTGKVKEWLRGSALSRIAPSESRKYPVRVECGVHRRVERSSAAESSPLEISTADGVFHGSRSITRCGHSRSLLLARQWRAAASSAMQSRSASGMRQATGNSELQGNFRF